ncbi:MAG TPA: hypothetical protein VF723_12665 [Pyrinomonadaceae bacterium]|jgi:hypothetical protein
MIRARIDERGSKQRRAALLRFSESLTVSLTGPGLTPFETGAAGLRKGIPGAPVKTVLL